MSEVFYTQFMVDLNDFDRMMQEDDMKKYFKQRLAIELAHQLIESNRTQFTYTTLHDRDAIRLSAKVQL